MDSLDEIHQNEASTTADITKCKNEKTNYLPFRENIIVMTRECGV